MKIVDILKSEECEKLFLEVQEFAKISLSEYNDRLEKDEFDYSEKDIFDFVWGTVNFSKAEICVLDSPLLQRLRRIRHLGLADVVYCNATSSRFSHTIGVMEVAGRMANVINQKLEANEGDYDFCEIVRMAAIFHDVGHMFYSHVSELFFAQDELFPRYREITKARTYFCEQTSSNTAFHEMLSVMIVNSPEALRLFKNISPYMKKTRMTSQANYEQFAEYISCLIIGVPVDNAILPYVSIINSSVDADKLDYLSRDSESTKVPIAVDIARIIQKLDVVNIKGIVYPAIWNGPKHADLPLRIMAIKNSAKKVFWQLSNARSSMYESVYYHHKVLTAESMFREALKKMFRNIAPDQISFKDILQWTDDTFNDYWYLTILPKQLDQITQKEISEIFTSIRERNLYKRVAAFSRDSLSGDLSLVRNFFRNVIQNPLSKEYQNFIARMKDEYHKIRELLNVIPEQKNDPVFMFVYARYDAMASMPIESGNGFCIWSSALMKQETMEAGKKSRQEQFYLLTNCKDRAHVYLALEKVLLEFGITKLSQEASVCSKVSYDELNQKRNTLLEKDYYRESLILLQDDMFVQMLDSSLVNKVQEKYASFLGVGSCKIKEEQLVAFLRQFLWLKLSKKELVSLLDGVLRILDSAYYIDRESFTKQAGELFSKLAELPESPKHIITLGGQFDSAQHLTYYFNDMPERKNLTFDGSVENAFLTGDKGSLLCFFDDGAYSGSQVISIFQEFMGVTVEERTTNEHHVDELSAENKERLKQSEIVLLYLCFNKDSENYIKEELKKLGIAHVQIIYYKDLSEKIFEQKKSIFKTIDQRDLVRKNLQDIGENVLRSTKVAEDGVYKERWDETRVKKAALGYNDAQQMVVFSTNIPTYSISAFWCNGRYEEHEWRGLFQRTKKD